MDSGTGWRVWVPKIWKEAFKNIKTHLEKNVEIQSLRSKDLTVENENDENDSKIIFLGPRMLCWDRFS